ncbi:MAG: phosphatidylserine decarboxylase [Candidatus Cloacimonetes bacterium 4572_55]|nr:MAG: phosphatidylserine decarboxylase [Candidatus Cloacimonetes bacterium 4572_55]
MKLPFDKILLYYLTGGSAFFCLSAFLYWHTSSKFFLWLTFLTIFVNLFFCWFFRDPHRSVPQEANLVISAADGKVLEIKEIYEPDYIQADTKQIIIFLSPLDVHVNRSPVAGTIEWVSRSKGAHKPAYSDDAERNEQNSIGIKDEQGQKFLVRQIVGTLARRILCRVEEGASLDRGQRIGIIQFGSRTDIFVPVSCEIKVNVGERVKGGETILGVLQ